MGATTQTDEFEFDTPEDMDAGGGFLSVEGSFHLIVTDVTTRPISKKTNQLIDGWKVAFGVLAGTVDKQAGKTVDLIFFNPKLDGKDQGAFAKKKQARFLRAVSIIRDDDKGKKKKISLQDARGRQCVAKLEKDDDTGFMQLAFADIFHVDDAEVAKIPKDATSLGEIPSDQRMVSGQSKPQNKDGKDSHSEPVKPATDVNLDDI